MTRDDAEAFSEGLGKVFGGGADLIYAAEQMGVPAALGMTTREWVHARLSGYVRLSLEERRDKVRELTAPIENGGKGLSTRKAADVLGIDQSTVVRDRQTADASASPVRESDDDSGRSADASASPVRESDELSPIGLTPKNEAQPRESREEIDARQRREAALISRRNTTDRVTDGLTTFDPKVWPPEDRAADLLSKLDPEPLPDGTDVTPDLLRRCAAVLECMADALANQQED